MLSGRGSGAIKSVLEQAHGHCPVNVLGGVKGLLDLDKDDRRPNNQRDDTAARDRRHGWRR